MVHGKGKAQLAHFTSVTKLFSGFIQPGAGVVRFFREEDLYRERLARGFVFPPDRGKLVVFRCW